MKKLFAGIVAVAFVGLVAAPAFAAVETVTGTLVDQNCYMKDKTNTGVCSRSARSNAFAAM